MTDGKDPGEKGRIEGEGERSYWNNSQGAGTSGRSVTFSAGSSEKVEQWVLSRGAVVGARGNSLLMRIQVGSKLISGDEDG